ncbi:MAG: HDOD domain-containing protein [Burkholderiales bacterium]|nr:HDOD domain-containing protein [Burkholderiales bacterium]
MSAIRIDEVLEKLQGLPALSSILEELLESFEDENLSIQKLEERIGKDQGLSAKVLRVANSPFYGFSSKIGSIRQAVVVLGFDSVRSIAVASGIIDTLSGLDSRAFWEHGSGTGSCAREIAKRVGLHPEAAFAAGLLHDVGKLVLEMHFTQEFGMALEHARREDCEMIVAEKEVLGIDHCQVGHAVAARWKFPWAMQVAIRDHHHPDGEVLTDVVHVANALCHALAIGNSGYDFVPRISHAAWQRLGLDFAWLKECFAEVSKKRFPVSSGKE